MLNFQISIRLQIRNLSQIWTQFDMSMKNDILLVCSEFQVNIYEYD
jgi:hypothetical protein